MHGVGAGRIVGDRYLLNERRASRDSLEVWTASDQRLGREVSLTVLATTHPRAQALLDAARRVAVLDDDRLVRVLDAGSRGEIAWVTEESLHPSVSLAQLLHDGPLEAGDARYLAGEVASVLDLAARRGLHHLHLTPHAVRRMPDGRIKVAGVATAAAIEGTPDPDPAEALRTDVVGILAVTYAALTTRWPLPTQVPGLAAAPRVVGGVPAPSEIAVGVPSDLDHLCRVTLTGAGGPRTPDELASQLAPWRSRPRSGGAAGGDGEPTTPVATPRQNPGQTPAKTPAWGARQVSPSPSSRPAEPPATVVIPVTPPPPVTPVAPAARATAHPDAAAAAGGAGAADSATQDAGSAPTEVIAVAGAVTAKVGSFARAAADKASALREQVSTDRAERLVREDSARTVTLGESMAAAPQRPSEAPAPLIRHDPSQRDGSHAGVILAIIAVVVIVSMVLAVSTLFGHPDSSLANGTSTASASASSSPSASPSPSAVARKAIAIVSATGFDPEGDGTEYGSRAPRAYDGDVTTMWQSEGYRNNPVMGGTKSGVGIIFQIADKSQVSSVQLTLTDKPQDLTVYVASDKSTQDATEIGRLTDATGVRTVSVPSPAVGQYVIVWFTKAGSEGDNLYRCSLAEIRIT